jgi:hypothetical protein
MATWETTFYYQQELRSTFMNNLINGLIRPGIYNMNAAIYTESTAAVDKQPGVYLRINPGAILVFSNNFAIVDNRRIRDESKVGTYLVKCVLRDTADIPLSTVSTSGGTVDPTYLTSTNRIPVALVTAMFEYDPENLSNTNPDFALVIPSSYRTTYTSPTNKLPNEDLLTAGGDEMSSENLSYLILGALIDRSVPFGGTYTGAYATTSEWVDPATTDEWMSNHVFTGRAFPEYRESVLKNYGSPVPSLGFSPYYKHMYLTPGQFYYNGVLYSVGGTSWKRIYGQGQDVEAVSPTSASGFSTDGVYSTIDSTSYTESTITDFAANAGKLVVEFLFMALKSEYSSGGEGEDVFPDLSTIFTSTDVEKKLLPFRVVCDDPGVINLNTLSTDSGTDIQIAFSGLGKKVIPLDVSVFNINRLKKMLLNKNVLLKVIDAIRQYGDTQSPFLVAGVGDSLLPLMVSFRKINAAGTGYEDAQSANTAVKDSGGVPHSAVNPANILSFFEIQSSGYTVQSANLAAQETFTTLPFLGE